MLGLIQRVSHAKVSIQDRTVGAIAQGSLVLVAIEPGDTDADIERMGDKLLGYRIFADGEGKTNLSLVDVKGGLLLVPQFSLAADTRKGLRPSFSSAAAADFAKQCFEQLVSYCNSKYDRVETGQFGADMQVSLCNDGPLTFMLRVPDQARD